jgi:hypothetical protein
VISPAAAHASGGARFGPSRKYRAGECMMPLSTDGSCLLTAVVLGALLNSLAGPVALSHPSEPHAAEAQSISASTCDAEDVGVAQLGSLPIAEMPSTEIAAARNYLIETASPGYTMARQGPELAIGRLIPRLAVRDLPPVRCPIMHIFDLTRILRRGCRHEAGHGESVFVSVGIILNL